ADLSGVLQIEFSELQSYRKLALQRTPRAKPVDERFTGRVGVILRSTDASQEALKTSFFSDLICPMQPFVGPPMNARRIFRK
ncbi:MAG: hypothetical protein WBE14_14375, partial [Xanthobacteraceae bacterium]